MNLKPFFHSAEIIARRDVSAHFRDISENVLTFLYFATGVAFWAATLGRLAFVASYFQFLIVGLLVLGVYNTSFNYMNTVSTEVRRGYMKYLLSLPISRSGFSLGRIIAGSVEGIVYAAVLLAFAILVMGLGVDAKQRV